MRFLHPGPVGSNQVPGARLCPAACLFTANAETQGRRLIDVTDSSCSRQHPGQQPVRRKPLPAHMQTPLSDSPESHTFSIVAGKEIVKLGKLRKSGVRLRLRLQGKALTYPPAANVSRFQPCSTGIFPGINCLPATENPGSLLC